MKAFKLLSYCLLLLISPLTIAQTCNPAIIADAPDSRYILNTNGTVTDKKTTLMWMRCALGQTWDGHTCTGSSVSYNWQSALQMADSTVFAGFSDWRLPNQKELQSLVENRCYDPAINLTAFPNASSDWFWSSSPSAYGSGTAWVVDFYDGNGYDDLKDSYDAVRLVRGGQ